jgi:hypothetical protein
MTMSKQGAINAYRSLISPAEVEMTLAALAAAHEAIELDAQSKGHAYKNKSQLVGEKIKLENRIKALEATALMQIEGGGKDQYVIVNDRKIPLTNDTSRDAYRRNASADDRERLAQVEADIARIDIELEKSNNDLYAAKDALEVAKSKSSLQAALLNFLAAL